MARPGAARAAFGLAARGTYLNQLAARQALVAAYADRCRLSNMRFRAGVHSCLPTLDAQRSLYAAQRTRITLKQSELANRITLYKALGGGWNEHTHTPRRDSESEASGARQ